MTDKADLIDYTLVGAIKSIVYTARKSLAQKINHELVFTYWQVGKEIVETELKNKVDSPTSRQVILNLSKLSTKEIDKGFSRYNLFNMRRLYLGYSNVQTVSGHLIWSHICELLVIENKEKRLFYETEFVKASWTIRELKRQISSSLYKRISLSKASKAISLSDESKKNRMPEYILKDQYVFEFLGLSENKPLLERDLEAKLIRHIEEFLLELGRGFMFVGSQQRITINNTHYYVDMVFYNKILKSYILVELKTTKLNISDGGQLNTYLNYYKTEVNEEFDNPPVGIILCTEKGELTAEYILGGFENNLFASRNLTILPDKQKLIEELENVLNEKRS